jgi:hypothetical protein
MNTQYINKPAVFISKVAEAICFGHTGVAHSDASSGHGYWFLPDGLERAVLVQPTEVWFDEDAYITGPPNYK